MNIASNCCPTRIRTLTIWLKTRGACRYTIGQSKLKHIIYVFCCPRRVRTHKLIRALASKASMFTNSISGQYWVWQGLEPYSPDSQSGTLASYANHTVRMVGFEPTNRCFQGIVVLPSA